MLKKNLITLAIALSFSSQAFAVETPELIEGRLGGKLIHAALFGDHIRGPQPTVPPVTLGSKSGGGFLPPGPGPGAPGEDLPKLLVAGDLNEDGNNIEAASIDVIIEKLYMVDKIRKDNPGSNDHILPDLASAIDLSVTIGEAKAAGELAPITAKELIDMIKSWYE